MMSIPALPGMKLVACLAIFSGCGAKDIKPQEQQKRQKESARVDSWKSATFMATVLKY